MKRIRLLTLDSMPALGLGTWKAQNGMAYDAVRKAIDIGYRHIDCAWIYANEADVGRAINDAITSRTVSRDQLWITSKLWNNSHQVGRVRAALETTLNDLQLEYVDLYLMHWPIALKPNVVLPESAEDFFGLDQVPLAETWQAMERCAAAGLCRNIGVSNFNRPKIEHLMGVGSIAPAVNQVESHPYLQQTALVEFCRQHGIAFTAYAPLGSGDRPERMRRNDEPALMDDAVLREIAGRREISTAQLMIAWAINRGTVAIPKSASDEHLRQNFQAAEIELSDEEMTAIASLDRGYRFIDGTFWSMPGSPYTVRSLWSE